MEIAIRGFIIDIFPVNFVNPVRIEFWGEEVESIRFFDVNSQLTIEKIKEIKITIKQLTHKNMEKYKEQ